ncbi:hypothetical protein [Pararhizobium arenae]|uniref:hypothetical protein n=1 Tax=Pararhizobium arenae TaxID=1856850 RepID=UPI000A4D67E5|nr:hypothetical protein [Pararhizobium arenae]
MIRIMDSHAYPGCPARIDQEPEDGFVPVEFSDGTVVGAKAKRLDRTRMTLTIDAYRTSRGTAISQKSWRLEQMEEDRWRVTRKLEL